MITNLAIIGSDRISSPTPFTSTTKAISYFLTVVETKSTWKRELINSAPLKRF